MHSFGMDFNSVNSYLIPDCQTSHKLQFCNSCPEFLIKTDYVARGDKRQQEKDNQRGWLAMYIIPENWPENWDTYGAKKPNKRAKKTAEKFAQQFYNFVQRHALEWVNPNISANSDGNIVFEWWNKNNKLAVYAQPDEIFYITASNPNIEEMRDVTLELNDSGFSTMWESLQ